jgi:hypothetical protein
MRASGRANLGIAALVVLVLALGFVGYRYSQYGQPGRPAAGAPAQADEKPPGAYNARPR